MTERVRVVCMQQRVGETSKGQITPALRGRRWLLRRQTRSFLHCVADVAEEAMAPKAKESVFHRQPRVTATPAEDQYPALLDGDQWTLGATLAAVTRARIPRAA